MAPTDQETQLANLLVRFPMTYCSPCYFGDPSDSNLKVNNGTMTLIRLGGRKFGITNYHVIQEYRNRFSTESNIRFCIGNAEIDLNASIIDEDEDLDLCTLDLESYQEENFSSGSDVPTSFFEVSNFELNSLQAGNFVLLGGYPGVWRERPASNHLIFDTLSSGGTEVMEISERNIRCEIAIERCITSILNNRDQLPENLGGLSGGPVFQHTISEGGISVFEFVGVIYEHIPNYDSILVRPAKFLNDDFSIKR